jgi:hypothetical protein
VAASTSPNLSGLSFATTLENDPAPKRPESNKRLANRLTHSLGGCQHNVMLLALADNWMACRDGR